MGKWSDFFFLENAVNCHSVKPLENFFRDSVYSEFGDWSFSFATSPQKLDVRFFSRRFKLWKFKKSQHNCRRVQSSNN